MSETADIDRLTPFPKLVRRYGIAIPIGIGLYAADVLAKAAYSYAFSLSSVEIKVLGLSAFGGVVIVGVFARPLKIAASLTRSPAGWLWIDRKAGSKSSNCDDKPAG